MYKIIEAHDRAGLAAKVNLAMIPEPQGEGLVPLGGIAIGRDPENRQPIGDQQPLYLQAMTKPEKHFPHA